VLAHLPDAERQLISGDFVGDECAKIIPNYMQTKIDSGCASCGGKDVAIIEVKEIRLKLDQKKSAAKCIDIFPMDHRTSPI